MPLPRDEALAAELDEYRQTVGVLETGVARDVPPPQLFDRILGEVQPQAEAPAEPRGRSWSWRPTLPRLALAAAAAVLLGVLAGVLVTRGDGLGSPAAEATLAAEETPDPERQGVDLQAGQP